MSSNEPEAWGLVLALLWFVFVVGVLNGDYTLVSSFRRLARGQYILLKIILIFHKTRHMNKSRGAKLFFFNENSTNVDNQPNLGIINLVFTFDHENQNFSPFNQMHPNLLWTSRAGTYCMLGQCRALFAVFAQQRERIHPPEINKYYSEQRSPII